MCVLCSLYFKLAKLIYTRLSIYRTLTRFPWQSVTAMWPSRVSATPSGWICPWASTFTRLPKQNTNKKLGYRWQTSRGFSATTLLLGQYLAKSIDIKFEMFRRFRRNL